MLLRPIDLCFAGETSRSDRDVEVSRTLGKQKYKWCHSAALRSHYESRTDSWCSRRADHLPVFCLPSTGLVLAWKATREAVVRMRQTVQVVRWRKAEHWGMLEDPGLPHARWGRREAMRTYARTCSDPWRSTCMALGVLRTRHRGRTDTCGRPGMRLGRRTCMVRERCLNESVLLFDVLDRFRDTYSCS